MAIKQMNKMLCGSLNMYCGAMPMPPRVAPKLRALWIAAEVLKGFVLTKHFA